MAIPTKFRRNSGSPCRCAEQKDLNRAPHLHASGGGLFTLSVLVRRQFSHFSLSPCVPLLKVSITLCLQLFNRQFFFVSVFFSVVGDFF